MKNVLIIPTLNPNKKLVDLIKELKKVEFENILIIDDGSNSSCTKIFDEIEAMQCVVLHHEINLGKGKAIKDGIKFASLHYKNIDGYITADGDYQHLPKDILKVAKELEKNHNNIVLGERNFREKNVPTRSKFGNKFSSIYFKMSTGIELEDTQTGLRAIPANYTKLAIETEGTRYDYEMNFLINAANENIEFTKIPIETVYEQKNTSHFKTVSDAILIYKELFQFAVNSVLSALIDVGFFTILVNVMSLSTAIQIAMANILARITSGMFNFAMNSKVAFKSKEDVNKQVYKYMILFIIQMAVSSGIVSLLSMLPINITVAKIFVDIAIFIVNYFIQKRFIFQPSSSKKNAKSKCEYGLRRIS